MLYCSGERNINRILRGAFFVDFADIYVVTPQSGLMSHDEERVRGRQISEQIRSLGFGQTKLISAAEAADLIHGQRSEPVDYLITGSFHLVGSMMKLLGLVSKDITPDTDRCRPADRS